MPPSLNTQRIVAFIWDFDKTLSPGYMQDPLFKHFGVEAGSFWREVNALVKHYEDRGLRVAKDTAYLGHILTYIQQGRFSDLSNSLLRELGAQIELAPGIPDFFKRTKDLIKDDERFAHHGISVEHYVVSTGLRQMIEGTSIREHIDGVWACELLSDPPGPGYLDLPENSSIVDPGPLTQIGYVLDNTTKTRAVFEINKGVNVERSIDVNARMSSDERRVPFSNMIYIADGPSDVPVFSVVGRQGGKTLGVYTGAGDSSNYEGVQLLQEHGRVNQIAKADFTIGTEADLWLMYSLKKMATEICDRVDASISAIAGPAGHKV